MNDDMWKVFGRARFDLDFGGRLKQDFEGTVAQAGYNLDAEELADAKRAVDRLLLDPGALTPVGPALQISAEEEAKMRKIRVEQMERMGHLTEYMTETVKKTFGNASLTYKSIALMSWLTFGVGILLFAFSALYALVSPTKAYSILFAGMGVSSFVSSFIFRTPEQAQRALSHLVETEIAFMNYFDQQCFWETYAQIPHGYPPAYNPANIEKASASLMNCANQSMAMLKKYVDDLPAAKLTAAGKAVHRNGGAIS